MKAHGFQEPREKGHAHSGLSLSLRDNNTDFNNCMKGLCSFPQHPTARLPREGTGIMCSSLQCAKSTECHQIMCLESVKPRLVCMPSADCTPEIIRRKWRRICGLQTRYCLPGMETVLLVFSGYMLRSELLCVWSTNFFGIIAFIDHIYVGRFWLSASAPPTFGI